MEQDRKKLRAIYVFEIVVLAYIAGIIAIQTWLVHLR